MHVCMSLSSVYIIISLHYHYHYHLFGIFYALKDNTAYDKVHICIPLHADQVLAVFYTCDTSSIMGDNPVPVTSSSHLDESKVKV